MTFEAITELAVFGDFKNHQIQYAMRNYEEKKKIIDTFKKDFSA